MEQETRIMEPIPAEDEIKITATPWLEEVSDARRGDSLEWPADSDRDIQHRERIDTPRVRHLFPVPEDADWEVSHLEFEYTAATASAEPLKPARRHRHPLLAGGEEVAVDLGQAGEVVDVLVEVGDADHAAGAQLVGEVVDVAGVALGQGLVVGEVGGDALGEVLASPSFSARAAGRSSTSARSSSAG